MSTKLLICGVVITAWLVSAVASPIPEFQGIGHLRDALEDESWAWGVSADGTCVVGEAVGP